MRWKEYKYYSAKDEGDELGNYERVPDKLIKKMLARVAPWSSSDIEKYGRDITETTFKLLARSPFVSELGICEYVEIEGELLEITKHEYLGDRYYLAFVKKVF